MYYSLITIMTHTQVNSPNHFCSLWETSCCTQARTRNPPPTNSSVALSGKAGYSGRREYAWPPAPRRKPEPLIRRVASCASAGAPAGNRYIAKHWLPCAHLQIDFLSLSLCLAYSSVVGILRYRGEGGGGG